MKQILIIILILITCSCSKTDTTNNHLTHAHALMNEYPDSALSILEKTEQQSLNNGYNKAYHALLLTQARYKNYIFETNDSLISSAVKYFEKNNHHENLFFSLYYRALIYFNNEKYNSSLIDALRAHDICEESDSALFSAKIHELLADIYNTLYNLDIAIFHREKAYINYIKAQKKDKAIYSLINLAREYSSFGKPNKAIDILNNAESDIEKNDSMLLGFLYDSYMYPLLNLGKTDDALTKFRLAQKFLGNNFSSYLDYPTASLIFINSGQIDSAEYYLKHATKHNESYHNAQYKLQKAKKNYIESIAEFEKMFNTHNEKVNKVLQQSNVFKEREYYNSKSEIEYFRIEVLIFILITTCLCFFFEIRRNKQKSDERMHEAQELTQQVQNQKTILEKQHFLVTKLFQSHYETLDTLSNEYFEKKDSDIMRRTIVKDFEKEINKMKHPESLKKLEIIVNECRNNIIARLKYQFPQFKEKDILFLTLIFAGFSPRSVCLFTDIKIGNYYNKKARIKRKIEASNSPDKTLFISAIDNTLKNKQLTSQKALKATV